MIQQFYLALLLLLYHLLIQAFTSLENIWKEFVPNEAAVWNRFYEYWKLQAVRIPVLIVRYEDIMQNETAWTEKIMEYLASGNVPHRHRWEPQWNFLRESTRKSMELFSSSPGYQPKQVNFRSQVINLCIFAILFHILFAMYISKRIIGKSLSNVLSISQAEQVYTLTRNLCNEFGYEVSLSC